MAERTTFYHYHEDANELDHTDPDDAVQEYVDRNGVPDKLDIFAFTHKPHPQNEDYQYWAEDVFERIEEWFMDEWGDCVDFEKPYTETQKRELIDALRPLIANHVDKWRVWQAERDPKKDLYYEEKELEGFK